MRARFWYGALGLSFFGSLTLALLYFPQPYRWTETVISSLASPRDNPHGYRIASGGLALSGLWLLLLGAELRAKLGPWAPAWVRGATFCWSLGALALTASAVIVPGPTRLFHQGHIHERLAELSGAAFYLALLSYLPAYLRKPSPLFWPRCLGLTLLLGPMLALGLDRVVALGFCYLAPERLPEWMRNAWWDHLAFWEWTGAVTLFLFLGWTLFCWGKEE